VCVCVCACVCVCVRVCVCVCLRVCLYWVRVLAYVCEYVRVCMYLYVCVCMCVCLCAYLYVCVWSQSIIVFLYRFWNPKIIRIFKPSHNSIANLMYSLITLIDPFRIWIFKYDFSLVGHDALMCGTRLFNVAVRECGISVAYQLDWHMGEATHSYMRLDNFILGTWLIDMWVETLSFVWHVTFICERWLVYMCDVTHSYVQRDSFICVAWPIFMCDMTQSYVWSESFICET